VELYAGLEAGKPIVFRCCGADASEPDAVSVSAGNEAANMLDNFSFMADAASADCAVAADRERELGTNIGWENVPRLNLAVRSALGAGRLGFAEVDAFACGEPEMVLGLEGFGNVIADTCYDNESLGNSLFSKYN
jgi:hypothetical protein